MTLDSETSTTPRVTTSRLSSKKIPSLNLLTTSPALIYKVTTSTMSWDNQISAKESKYLVSRKENTLKASKDPKLLCLNHLTIS